MHLTKNVGGPRHRCGTSSATSAQREAAEAVAGLIKRCMTYGLTVQAVGQLGSWAVGQLGRGGKATCKMHAIPTA